MRKIFNEDIMKDIMNSGEVISETEKEWDALKHDREILRQVKKKISNLELLKRK